MNVKVALTVSYRRLFLVIPIFLLLSLDVVSYCFSLFNFSYLLLYSHNSYIQFILKRC